MGARLYNSTTGHFTSPDPEYGGNDTTYIYPTDPINNSDLDGRKVNFKRAGKKVGSFLWKYKWNIALTAASFIPVVGAAAWAYRAYRIEVFSPGMGCRGWGRSVTCGFVRRG